MFSKSSIRFVFITLLLTNLFISLNAQNITLADFGPTESGNFFGLTGWDDLLISDRMVYADAGPGGQAMELVSLKVYDVLGRQVATLVNEQQHPGYYEVTWDASGVSSGVYFYKLSAGTYSEAKKMLLLR